LLDLNDFLGAGGTSGADYQYPGIVNIGSRSKKPDFGLAKQPWSLQRNTIFQIFQGLTIRAFYSPLIARDLRFVNWQG